MEVTHLDTLPPPPSMGGGCQQLLGGGSRWQKTYSGEAKGWDGHGGRTWAPRHTCSIVSSDLTCKTQTKLLRISRQLLQSINSQVSEPVFLGRSHVLEADPIHNTKPDYFISDFYIFYHSNCLSMLKPICTVAFLKFNIFMERAWDLRS